MFDLTGRRALVTGASRGLGRAIALTLARLGADVVVHFAGNRQAAQAVADEIRSLGRRSSVVGVDLADDAAAPRLIDQSRSVLGGIDILVLNASVQHRAGWQEVSRSEFEQQINVNFRSVFESIQLALPAMIQQRWGRVLTIGSVQQTVPSPMMPIYAASKAALLNLIRNLARQVATDGDTINNLAPGLIDTDRNAQALSDPVRRNQLINRIPVGYPGTPDDCCGTALLLCSDAGRYITGADFYVDGGWSLQ
ncbi:MAG TPA: SDR family oxidoreductase [Tepidisphaeraceae bacterium]|nr:SDR family oxidoreductase [Tepidisphaeraceae bacterium]